MNMGITINLDHILLDRKMTLTELSERVGLTIANLSILKTNKAKAIRFSTLEALCRELNCQPADLLRYSADAPSNRE
jgi:putative transcriptional regulator